MGLSSSSTILVSKASKALPRRYDMVKITLSESVQNCLGQARKLSVQGNRNDWSSRGLEPSKVSGSRILFRVSEESSLSFLSILTSLLRTPTSSGSSSEDDSGWKSSLGSSSPSPSPLPPSSSPSSPSLFPPPAPIGPKIPLLPCWVLLLWFP